jgi:hypothetical protein
MKRKNEKDHRARRNMGSAEFFRKQRKERNAARGKQTWIEGSLNTDANGTVVGSTPGHWERTINESL